MKKISLDKYKKSELIWIIRRMLQATSLCNQEYILQKAINDLEYEKEKDLLDRADKCVKQSKDLYDKYIELMRPYDGVPFKDIPDAVLFKARDLLAEAEKSDRMFEKLVGIPNLQ